MFLPSPQAEQIANFGLDFLRAWAGDGRAWVAAHLSSWPTLLLPKDAPPADFPFDAAGSPDAIRGATPARTRMAFATCPTRILECPCLAIPECHRCERGAARGNSSLLQSPAAGVDSHAPVDSGTGLTLAGQKPSGSYRARSTAHSARSITVISMGSVLLPADRSSRGVTRVTPGPGAAC